MATQVNENNPQTYSFALKQITLIEKSFQLYSKKDKKVDYDYDISLQITPDITDNQSFHLMTVSIFPKGQENDVIATFSLGFIFEITNLVSIAIIKDEDVTLPDGLLSLLNAVVIGTMRGVIFSELRGTQAEDAILPVLDPNKFQLK